MQRKYADPPPQFADIGRWCGFFMSLRGVALDLVLATIGLLYERAVAPRPAQHHSADHWGREYQENHLLAEESFPSSVTCFWLYFSQQQQATLLQNPVSIRMIAATAKKRSGRTCFRGLFIDTLFIVNSLIRDEE